MQFTFLKNGTVAFMRSDAEQAAWTQEEQTVNATFPFIPDKVIERGMVIIFQYLGAWYAFEIRNCTIIMGDSYQQLTAEGLAISELTDCHIGEDREITEISARDALQSVIAGTDWQIGTDTSTGVSSCDIGRGSVWQAVNTIANNWNVYITPRVTIDSNGITGRYLDISMHGGAWRGLRLSIDKNMSDATVTYDDSELYTALYGYGGSVPNEDGGEEKSKEVTFEKLTWAKAADHPAKPEGQKYLEWPEKTALYGRNGKPRFGFFQNTSIKDPEILLEKTWEQLKICSEPKITISGTCTDLKRLGYADVPIMLHDLAVVEIRPAGLILQREIIQATIDLLDPTATTPTVGDYIPNIIYINRETYDETTGEGGGASGGRGGGNRRNKERGEFETDILVNERNINAYSKQVNEQGEVLRQAGMRIDPISGVLIYAEDTQNMIGSQFRVQSNRITAEVTQRTEEGARMRSKIEQQADKISLVVSEKDGKSVVNAASIVVGINDQKGSYIKLKADKIDLQGYVTASQLNATNAKINNLTSGATTASSLKTNLLSAAVGFTYQNHNISVKNVTIDGTTYHLLGY